MPAQVIGYNPMRYDKPQYHEYDYFICVDCHAGCPDCARGYPCLPLTAEITYTPRRTLCNKCKLPLTDRTDEDAAQAASIKAYWDAEEDRRESEAYWATQPAPVVTVGFPDLDAAPEGELE